jgi:hypothetical protein
MLGSVVAGAMPTQIPRDHIAESRANPRATADFR